MVTKTADTTAKKTPAKKKPQPKTKAHIKSVGRPPLLTQEKYEKIIETIKLGIPISVVMGANGVGRTAYYNWMDRGRTELERMRMTGDKEIKSTEVVYVNFLNDVEQAKEHGTQSAAARILQAGLRGDWRADAWYLEKNRPDLFGKKEEVTFSGSIDTKAVVDMGELEAKVQMVLANRAKGEKK